MANMVDPYAPAEAALPTLSNGWMTVGGYQEPPTASFNGWMTVGGYQVPDEGGAELLP